MGESTDFLERIWKNETFRMLIIALGIILCFFYFGIVQEKVMRGCFGGESINGKCVGGERFQYEFTFIGILCFFYAATARGEFIICSAQRDAFFTYFSSYLATLISYCFIAAALEWRFTCFKRISIRSYLLQFC